MYFAFTFSQGECKIRIHLKNAFKTPVFAGSNTSQKFTEKTENSQLCHCVRPFYESEHDVH